MGEEIKNVDGPVVPDAVINEDAASHVTSTRSPARRIGSLFWSCALLCIFIVVGFQFGGLIRYAHLVTTPTAPIEGKADGIVVLTGGENRIDVAVQLLSEGRADRLLLTGVDPVLSEAALKKSLNVDAELFDCCIEIDWTARDTVGNALAAKKWIKQTGAKELMVVTGAFHMPRALKELGHAIQGVAFVPVAVNVPTSNIWWRDYSRLRDMLREYAKLMFVSGRDYLNIWMGQPWPTMPLDYLNDRLHVTHENSGSGQKSEDDSVTR